MLGLYDSGLGGLTVLAALRNANVDQDIVYFADQAHLPYGDKSDAQIHAFLAENLSLLAGLDVDAVITACNTTCAIAERFGWPSTTFPVLDIIATAGASFANTPHRRIGVVATAATVRSGAYTRAIGANAPHVEVIEVAAPSLVPIVERGETATETARRAVAEVVAEFPPNLDALVYGCTHYPLLDNWFAGALNPNTERIDPARAQAAAAKRLITERKLTAGTRTTTYYTNGDPTTFEAAVRTWTNDVTGRVAALVAR